MNYPELLKEADDNFQSKNYEQAEKLYTRLIEGGQSSETGSNDLSCLSQAYNNRGQIKYLRVDFEEAIEDYTESLKFNSSSEVTFYNRGLIHYRLGRYNKAIADFNVSLELNPDFKDATVGKSIAELEKSKHDGDRGIS